jgi:hypothetical protein
MNILYHILQTGRYAIVVDHLAVGTLSRVHHLEMDLCCTTAYKHELETKLSQKPWRQETANTSDWPRRNSDYASGITAWVLISTAAESAPNPTACNAASAYPGTETIWANVPHWLMGQSVSDTGRPGQIWWKSDCTPSLLLLLLLWLLIIRTPIYISNVFTGRIGQW